MTATQLSAASIAGGVGRALSSTIAAVNREVRGGRPAERMLRCRRRGAEDQAPAWRFTAAPRDRPATDSVPVR